MDEYYWVPSFVLLSILVSVFATLYWQSRTARRLLWLIGWTMAVLRLALELSPFGHSGWGLAISNSAMELAAVMFLGSLSPLEFGGRVRVQYVTVYGALLVLFSVLTAFYPSPGIVLRWLYVAIAVAALAVAVHWSTRKNLLPEWFTVAFSLCVGGVCVHLTYTGEFYRVLRLVHSGNCVVAALLVLAAYRRISAGVVFTAAGLLIWSAPGFLEVMLQDDRGLVVLMFRIVNLMKVITAVGMIVLVLEDELMVTDSVRNREERTREEMKRYSEVYLSGAPYRDFGIPYEKLCEVITSFSRFQQAAILLRGADRSFFVAGRAGMDEGVMRAVDEIGRQLTPEKLEAFGKSRHLVKELGSTTFVDLRPLVSDRQELAQVKFTHAHVIPVKARSEGLLGVVILGGLKDPSDRLLAEDLLPLELLVTRLAAAYENGLLLRRVSQSERLAGLGQLAGGLAHELNNPLTVVLGYAELIEESITDDGVRRNAGVIRQESQRMKQIIESLARFWRSSPSDLAPIAVGQMLTDIGRLRKQEFERVGIKFEVQVAEDLPRVMANGDQLRQVFLQILNNSVAALKESTKAGERKLRISATNEGESIRVLIADTGPGFPDPERVFDPFFTTKPPGEGTGLGLSLCYSIIREHGGEISVSNLQPCGAAVVIEVPTDVANDRTAAPREAFIR